MINATIIIVTYNHAAYIADCLHSLLALDPAPHELIVVDNASRDATVNVVKEQFPDVRLVQTGANLGFGGGCNFGVRVTKADYIVLANPDLVVRPDWLMHLCEPLDRWDHVGVAGGKLLYRDDRTIQHAGGEIRLPLALGHHRGVGELDNGQYDVIANMEYVTGAAFATRRSVWEQLGGMDDEFFPAYYEEVDFCTRVRQAGLHVIYTPRAVATHIEGSSVGHGSPQYLRLFHRNRLRYLFKYFNNTWLMRSWLPAELVHLRAIANDDEIEALQMVYLAYQSAFFQHENQPVISELDTFADETADGGETELQWVERQLQAKAVVTPRLLMSRNPIIAKIRNSILRLATHDYVAPIVQAQNDTNLSTHEAIRALIRQRRASDAAVLLQGMLLAKIMEEKK